MTSSRKGKNWTIHIFPAVIHKIVVAARHLLVGGLVLFVRDENEGLVLLKCAVLHPVYGVKLLPGVLAFIIAPKFASIASKILWS
jgi:hypothetical protein